MKVKGAPGLAPKRKSAAEKAWDAGYDAGVRDQAIYRHRTKGLNHDYYYYPDVVKVPGHKALLARQARAMNIQIRAANRAWAIAQRDAKQR